MRIKVLLISMLALMVPTPASASVDLFVNEIIKCQENINCITKTISQGKNPKELEKRFTSYLLLVKERPNLFSGCHTISHAIGKIAYERFGEKGFIKGQIACQYGFAHGYLVGMSNIIKGEKFISSGEKVCRGIDSVEERALCYHGIGHGAASAYSNFKSAVEGCLILKEHIYQNECVTGSSMERANSSMGFPTDFTEQVKLCESSKISVDPILLRSCLSQVLTYKLYLYDEVIGLEKKCIISSKVVKEGCYEAMGYITATYLVPKLKGSKSKALLASRVCQKDKSGWCIHSVVSRVYSLTDDKTVPLAVCREQKVMVAVECSNILKKLAS